MEASTCLEKLVGNSSVGVVLKDVSLEIHGGELMAVLGSKGAFSFETLPASLKSK
jgi:ATP-binding cassette, subfamily G (WHITE), member 5 (sterolin 1)